MTSDELRDFDELRNRIAYILETHQHMAIDRQACAIIDEFGLTVETVGGFVSVAGNHDARRVVGKWERCD